MKTETHESMAVVELFFDKELSDVVFNTESFDEWKTLVSDLGMEAQLKLCKGKESPIPYPFVNSSMQRVFETLCPTVVDFKEYDKTPIPLEVMKQISFCVKENHFSKIEIWYDDKSTDPIVIGKTGYWYEMDFYSDSNIELKGKEFATEKEVLEVGGNRPFYSNRDSYLIAKWGDVKRNFDELKELAKNRFIETYAAKMKSDIETLTGKLKTIEQNAVLYLSGEISLGKATTTDSF